MAAPNPRPLPPSGEGGLASILIVVGLVAQVSEFALCPLCTRHLLRLYGERGEVICVLRVVAVLPYLSAMLRRRFLRQSALVALATPLLPEAFGQTVLPKVALLGDSIRLGYSPFVIKALEGKATLFSPTDNGGETIDMLKRLHLWVQKEAPQVVHINCGLHDLKTLTYTAKPTDNLVPLHQYEENVGRIIGFIKQYSKARIIWATTTPVLEANVRKEHAQYQDHMRYETAVVAYNKAALKVCLREKVEVNDLNQFCQKNNLTALQLPDGVHYTEAGYQKLGEEVARVITKYL